MSEIERRRTDATGPRPLAVILVGVAASAVLAVAAFALLAPRDLAPRGASPADPSTAEPSTTPGADATPVAPVAPTEEVTEAEAVEDAATAAEQLIEASNTALALGDGTTPDISAIASGFVAGELQALAAERKALGFRQVGDAVVTSVTTSSIDLTSEPKRMQLEVCIDASGIDVVDENGQSLRDALYHPGTPVLHSYGAQLLDGSWKLTTHEIPTNGQCS